MKALAGVLIAVALIGMVAFAEVRNPPSQRETDPVAGPTATTASNLAATANSGVGYVSNLANRVEGKFVNGTTTAGGLVTFYASTVTNVLGAVFTPAMAAQVAVQLDSKTTNAATFKVSTDLLGTVLNAGGVTGTVFFVNQ